MTASDGRNEKNRATSSCNLCGRPILPSLARKTGLCLPCGQAEQARKVRETRAATRPGCPICEKKAAGGYWFHWPEALEGKGDCSKYPAHLRRVAAAKYGARYACVACGATWYLGDADQRMLFVPDDRLALFEAWSERSLEASLEILEMARSIGATPPDIYGNGRDYVQIPCRVTTRSGERLDRVLVSFQKMPPIPLFDPGDMRLPTLRLLDEIERIEPSRYGLSAQVRYATAQASEWPMDFAPTKVCAPDGRIYVLNWTVDFFDLDGIAGEEITLCREDENGGPIVRNVFTTAIFVGDWFPDVEALRLTQAALSAQ